MKIIAFSGYKQSGKNSCCNYLMNYIGQFGGLDNVKIYSFADKLKQFCHEVLGLSQAQCWGTDADKNTLTNLRWENMPGIVTPEMIYSLSCFETSSGFNLLDEIEIKNKDEHVCGFWDHDTPSKRSLMNARKWICDLIIHESGPMTAREVMQYFGTNIGRRMYDSIWVDACIRQIKADDKEYALICDMRFPNEFEAVKSAGGKCVRLTRCVTKPDGHSSETSLDEANFNWDKFDFIIRNEYLDEVGQNKVLLGWFNNLKEW